MKLNYTINEVKEAIKTNYRLNKEQKLVITPMIWGPAGIGKSQSIIQSAKELSEEFGEEVNICDVRAVVTPPEDLKGVPVVADGKVSLQQLGVLPQDPDWKGIIVFEEVNTATPTVQGQMYQVVLDHAIGTWKKPEGAIIVCTGNRAEDGGVTNTMPTPLCNRMAHYGVKMKTTEWLDYAYKNELADELIALIESEPSLLFKIPEDTDENPAFPTPRSLEFASTYIKDTTIDTNTKTNSVKAILGEEVSTQIDMSIQIRGKMPNIPECFKKKDFSEVTSKLKAEHDNLKRNILMYFINKAVATLLIEDSDNFDKDYYKRMENFLDSLNKAGVQEEKRLGAIRLLLKNPNFEKEVADKIGDMLTDSTKIREDYAKIIGVEI